MQELAELKSQLRGLQSDKDRAVVRNQKRIDDLEQTIQQYAQYAGVEVDPQAIRNMRIDQLLQKTQQPAPQVPPSPASGGVPQGVQLPADVFEKLGLDGNSPEVTTLYQKHGENTVDLLAGLVELAAQKRSQPSPNPAAVSAPTGGTGGSDEASLRQAYNNRLSKIRRGDVRRIHALQMEFRKKGLNI
jgi:hypothetical protein